MHNHEVTSTLLKLHVHWMSAVKGSGQSKRKRAQPRVVPPEPEPVQAGPAAVKLYPRALEPALRPPCEILLEIADHLTSFSDLRSFLLDNHFSLWRSDNSYVCTQLFAEPGKQGAGGTVERSVLRCLYSAIEVKSVKAKKVLKTNIHATQGLNTK